MRVLTLDAALDGCSAGLVMDGVVVSAGFGEGGRSQAATLPSLASRVLDGVPVATLDRIVVTVGPGSFTGIRAALALAHGIGLAAGLPPIGVTTGAALAAGEPAPDGWQVWAVIRGRAGHAFLQRSAIVESLPLEAMPVPDGPTILAGNAALEAMARMAGRPVRLAGRHTPQPEGIARAALSDPRLAEPLYAEPPRTTAPA